MMSKSQIAAHFDHYAPERDDWKRRNHYYYQELEGLCREHIPPGKAVLELGCGIGDLLASVQPAFGVGVDLSLGMVQQARRKYPNLHFLQGDAEDIPFIGHLQDVQTTSSTFDMSVNRKCGSSSVWARLGMVSISR